MNFPELLSPAGDFDCLKAAIQNGADAVYLGASAFRARASAHNFDLTSLQEAIYYAHIRGVKVHLTLNTLLKQSEFEKAVLLAKTAYNFGVDAIIVQDLGLACFLIEHFRDLPIHASTQMSIHNLAGVKKLEELGFTRAILSRELSLSEISSIVQSSSIEIETFIHGALCISYSGQCLFSSMVGGRSGNRGKCAQPCRLPYELVNQHNSSFDNGFLLSPRDLCGLELLPDLIDTGIHCFKIEGRMKSPEYVSTVTRIYRKYIDLYLQNGRNKFKVGEQDKKDLLQVFNRGGFSLGHFCDTENKHLIFKDRPNNIGLPLGSISNYNKNKGHITLTSKEPLSIGDTIMVEKENSKYTISELMVKEENKPYTPANTTVKIGRIKGNISTSDLVYKLSSRTLSMLVQTSIKKEQKKIPFDCEIFIKRNKTISLRVYCNKNTDSFYSGLDFTLYSDLLPEEAINAPITQERVVSQLAKTGNTPFIFENLKVYLDENLFLPNISVLNELRRRAISYIEHFAHNKTNRAFHSNLLFKNSQEKAFKISTEKSISLLLNNISLETNYCELSGISRIYIPLRHFMKKDLKYKISQLCENFSVFIYLPVVSRKNYIFLIEKELPHLLQEFKVDGFVVSNLGQLNMISNFGLPIIANYTMNVFNSYTVSSLKSLGINTFTLSPELEKDAQLSLLENSRLSSELIVYGRIPVMNSNYCLLGKTNKCYFNCKKQCYSKHTFYLKDRFGFKFPVVPDNIDTVNTIYNSKVLSIASKDFPTNSIRIDILEEAFSEIQEIIDICKHGGRLEGKDYTNGNLNRII